jgi:hypothetical protein
MNAPVPLLTNPVEDIVGATYLPISHGDNTCSLGEQVFVAPENEQVPVVDWLFAQANQPEYTGTILHCTDAVEQDTNDTDDHPDIVPTCIPWSIVELFHDITAEYAISVEIPI